MSLHPPTSLVVIDSGVEQYRHLADGALPNAEVVILDADRDGIEQISELLAKHQSLDSVHILSHGRPGMLQVGTTQLSFATLASHAPRIQQWANALSQTADILIYGCQVAAGELGRTFVQALAQLTRTNIAASSTLTGSAALGGDWDLGVRIGDVRSPLAFPDQVMQSYAAVLAVFDWAVEDWPGGLGTNTYNNVDGTDISLTITISADPGIVFGQANGNQTPDDFQFLQGGQAVVPDALHITMNADDNTDATTVTVEFSEAIAGVAFGIFDIDESFAVNGWQDEVQVLGFNGVTPVVATLVSSGINATYTIAGDVATGLGNAPSTGAASANGTLGVIFDSPITSYQIIYRNGPLAAVDPQEQGIGILSNILFDEPSDNLPPETEDATAIVTPDTTVGLNDFVAEDPEGDTIDFYTISTVPPNNQGTLFLGRPSQGGTPIEAGDTLTPNEIEDVFFQAEPGFTGSDFTYTATDDQGNEDATPATYTLEVNEFPTTEKSEAEVKPGKTVQIKGLSGDDPDGAVESFTITDLPPKKQGILFLGDPEDGGDRVEVGQVLTPQEIKQLFFRAKEGFDGTTFSYASTDDLGASDPTPAKVRINPKQSPGDNEPPTVEDVTKKLEPGEATKLKGLSGDDPDGTVDSYTIETLPPKKQGSLFLGNPDKNGTPVTEGQVLTPNELSKLFFDAKPKFKGTSFTYIATDNDNDTSAPGTVTLNAKGGGNNPPKKCKPGKTITGGGKGDDIVGTRNSDTLAGRKGQDSIRGLECDDLIKGGQGKDDLRGNSGADIIRGGLKSDAINGGGGDDVLGGGVGRDVVQGEAGNDRIQGGRRIDTLEGGEGDDSLRGGRGSDTLSGEDGDDTLNGGRGKDLMQGGDGRDEANGKVNADDIRGGQGGDRLRGGGGRDSIQGGQGNDRIFGEANSDRLLGGGGGNDRIKGESGKDKLRGGNGNDRLSGNSNEDQLSGGKGDDVLIGNRGRDRLRSGAGSDQFVFRSTDDGNDIIKDFTSGEDSIVLKRIFQQDAFESDDPFADFIQFKKKGSSTIVRLDTTGNEPGGFERIARLLDVNINSLSANDFVV